MELVCVHNPVDCKFISFTTQMIGLELSKNNKILIIDFDNFSNINNYLEINKEINLLDNNISFKKNKQNLYVIKVHIFKSINELNEQKFEIWLSDLINKFSDYDYVFLNTNNTDGIINNKIFKLVNKMILPLDVIYDNSNEILTKIINVKQIWNNKLNVKFIGFQSDKESNINNFIKAKKILSSFLFNELILVENKTDKKIKVLNSDVMNNFYEFILTLFQ